MPTVIDELVVELGLDPSDFEQSQKDILASYRRTQKEALGITQEIEKDVERGISKLVQGVVKQKDKQQKDENRVADEQAREEKKRIDERERRFKDMFSTLKKETLGFLGVLMGGRSVEQFVDYVTKTDAATGRLSRTMGIGTEALTMWGRAAEMAGGTAQGMAGDMLKLSNMQSEMRVAPSLGNPLQQIMNAVATAAGDRQAPDARMMSGPDSILRWVNREMSKVLAQAPDKAFLLRRLGFSEETISMLIGSPADMERRLAKGAETAVTPGETDRAQRFQESLAGMTQGIESVTRGLLQRFYPAMITVSDAVGGWFRRMGITLKEQEGDDKPGIVTQGLRDLADWWRTGEKAVVDPRTGQYVRPSSLRNSSAGDSFNQRFGSFGAPGALAGTAGLDPSLVDKLNALRAALPPGMDFSLTSGFRSAADQARLYANRGSNPYPVAPPGSSMHERGMAADLRFGSPEARAWIAAHAAEFGLHFPHARDPIHVEPITKVQGHPTGAEAAAAIASTTFNQRFGGDTNKSTTITFGDIHVTAPPGSDPKTVADTLQYAINHRLAIMADYGPR